MQNKANFGKSQMNVNLYNTTDYENISDWTLGENKPNSKPIQSQFKANQSQFSNRKAEGRVSVSGRVFSPEDSDTQK